MSTQADTLAHVYARSLFELATEDGGNEMVLEIADELEQICELAATDPKFGLFFSSPIIDCSQRGEALSAIFTHQVTDLTVRFLLVLNDKGRLHYLQQTEVAYGQLVQEAMGRVEVDVFTPVAVDERALQSIKEKVQELLGKEPVLHPYVDPAMLGGVKLRIGDQLFDGSVATKLRRLSESVKSKGSMAIRKQFETYLDDTK